jgi:hypothetical protein
MLLAAVAVAITASGAQAGGPTDVTGHVSERTGAFPGTVSSLAGATVELKQGATVVDSDTTSASGDYTVTLPIGEHHIVVSKTGYVTQCRKIFGNGSPQTPPAIEMPTPAQGAGMSGHVTDSVTHNPIGGVTVELSYDQGCDTLATTITDMNGLYVFPEVPGPFHLVTFSKVGYNSQTHENVFIYGTSTAEDAELIVVDTKDPRTKITDIHVKGHRATAKFKANDPAPSSGGINFTCQLDGDDAETCESPKKYGHLAKGRHKVKVIAFDSAGNFDDTPAKETFRVG